jgi:4-carboxymuconolactone decarboxylase
MSKHEQGMQRIKEVLGHDAEQIIKNFEKVSPDFAKYIVEFAYGELYSRNGLTDKHRELAAVASMIGQGNTGFPLKTHLKGMLNVGWTQNEILELIIFLISFVGFPPAVDAIKMAHELFTEK